MDIKKFLTKKNIFIFAGALIIISIIVMGVITIICGKSSKKLATAVDEAWLVVKSENQPEYLTKLDELSSYELNSVHFEKDRYIIETTVTAPDLGERLSQLDYSDFPQKSNNEEIDSFLCEQIEKAEIRKTTALIYAYKINGEYQITFSDKFADAMNGNLYKYSQETFVDILQKYEKGELK